MDSRWAWETFVSIRIPSWAAPPRRGDPTSSKRFSHKRPLSLEVISCLLLLFLVSNPAQICSTFLPLECARPVHVADSSVCIYAVKTGLPSKHRQMMSLQQRWLHLRYCNTWLNLDLQDRDAGTILSNCVQLPPTPDRVPTLWRARHPPPRPDGIT